MQLQLEEFCNKFGHTINHTLTLPDIKDRNLERNLIEEETTELLNALSIDVIEDVNDYIAIADGIIDSLYVIIHCAVAFGIDIEKVFDEVHRSNMSKVWPDGTIHKNEFGKVIKPPTYSPADFKNVLGL